MTSADATTLVVVDTNVLLAATYRSRLSHSAATDLLNEDERRLAINHRSCVSEVFSPEWLM